MFRTKHFSRKRVLHMTNKSLAFLLVFGITVLVFSSYLNPSYSRNTIPPVIHFIFYPPNNGVLTLDFQHFLAIYAAHEHNQECSIILHTTDTRHQCQYLNMLEKLARFQIAKALWVTKTDNGVSIDNPAHISDFYRLRLLLQYGGVYSDLDSILLKSLKALRESGFKAVVGYIDDDRIGTGLMLAQKSSQIMRVFEQRMHDKFQGSEAGWDNHSVVQLTDIASQHVGDSRELLLLPPRSFFPLGENSDRITDLYLPGRPKYDFNLSYAMHGFHESISGRFDFPEWKTLRTISKDFNQQKGMYHSSNFNDGISAILQKALSAYPEILSL